MHTITDDNIAQRALEALWSHPFLVPTGIDITVDNGVLTVSGEVASLTEMETTLDVLEDLYCTGEVRNRLTLARAPLARAA
jgi:HSP20 family molecular chaperone IbpA